MEKNKAAIYFHFFSLKRSLWMFLSSYVIFSEIFWKFPISNGMVFKIMSKLKSSLKLKVSSWRTVICFLSLVWQSNKFSCLYKNPGYDRKVHFLLDFNLDSKRHDYPKHQLYGTAATTMWNSIHIRQRPLGWPFSKPFSNSKETKRTKQQSGT